MNQYFAKKPAADTWDYAYSFGIDLDTGLLKFHIHDDMGDDFFFARLLVCPEIKTIYINEVFFYTLNHIEGYKESSDITNLPEYIPLICKLTESLLSPNYLFIKTYTPTTFQKDIAPFKETLADQLVPMRIIFPTTVTTLIAKSLTPEWTKPPNKPYQEKIKDLLCFNATDDLTKRFIASLSLFP